MLCHAPHEPPHGKLYDVTFENYWTKAQKHLVEKSEDWSRLLSPVSPERYRDVVLEEFAACLKLPRYLLCLDNTTKEKTRGAHGGKRRVPVSYFAMYVGSPAGILAAGEHDRLTDRVRIITAYRCTGFDHAERLEAVKQKINKMRMHAHENHHLTEVKPHTEPNWR